ncbi:MAG TPA: redoxin domain-containing protein [Gaiellaceae bacterium]|nr:redoxin domain-containing protein [Gaiellaceae bacterium]
MPVRWLVWSAALVAGIGGGVGIAAATQTSGQAAATIPAAPQVPNPRLDPGTQLNTVAPAFTLTDQFGRKVSLSSFRGKVVVLSFNDPQCTTICPLTTTAMLEAKQKLGAAAADVQLLGVTANPDATQVKWVRAYSQAHGMLHKWLFLTGSLPKLQRVWSGYGIGAAVVQGAIDHTPATFVVDPQGRETRLYISEMSYSSVPQLAEVMARGIAAALPGHPHVGDSVSLAPIPLIGPRKHVTLPRAPRGGTVELGPGHGPRLLLFFDTWENEVSNLSSDLVGLNRYATLDSSIAPLVAIDEANVEPSAHALSDLLRRTPALSYPIAIDADGRVADGYGVQDSPWLTLVSGSGRILWRYDVATNGWPSTRVLVNHVRSALAPARG